MRILMIMLVAAIFISCGHSNSVAPQNMVPISATLSSLQANVLTPKCVNAGCHPGGGAPMSLANGQTYSVLVNVPSAYNNLPRVMPGNAQQSVLWLKVTGATGYGAIMPPGGSLTQAEKDTLSAWINRGALNN